MNKKRQHNNSSGVTGVVWSNARGKWVAQIQVNYKSINLGGFLKMKDAVKCRKKAEKQYGFHTNHGKTDFTECQL